MALEAFVTMSKSIRIETSLERAPMSGVKGQCDPREEFFIAVVSVLVAPLAPLMIELGYTHQISAGTLLVSAIMYVASLAFSTDKKYLFFIGFLAVGFLCLVYGSAIRVAVDASTVAATGSVATLPSSDFPPKQIEGLTQNSAKDGGEGGVTLTVVADNSIYYSAIILMIGFGLAHLLQRVRMHLKESQPFLDFRISVRTSTEN
ncbi:hypothetical protein GEU84_008095 [Fertoebacter nigrum]|uniref:Uncharacterized protein n=1 Tax=Fertoeibacter niger TaxID=2656921 RepID=A0A8X8KNR9_9RHOB|nr:hypothetical protein [Fertoeibacter niger]NUB44340.1 hypothetical protein [Fertoeibacter niger]